MSATMPELLASYFSATNRHDVDAMLVPFAEGAVVKDEGKEWHGRAAIRAWMEETTAKYRVTVEVVAVATTGGETVVAAKVAGNFPGSPVQLSYRFTLDDGKIVRLEIG